MRTELSGRGRARRAGQYRWDAVARRWVCPMSPRLRSSLIAESENERDRTTPGGARTLTPLRHDTVDELGCATPAADVLSLQSVAHVPPTASELRLRVESLTKERDGAIAESADVRERLAALMREQLMAGKDSNSLSEFVKKAALDAAGGDPGFAQLIGDATIDDLPVRIQEGLADECRRILRVGKRSCFNDLLVEMRKGGLLTNQAKDLADIVRTVRNGIVHRSAPQPREIRRASAILVLMAGALLWPELELARRELGS